MKYNKDLRVEWKGFDPSCIGMDGFYPIPTYVAGRSLGSLYDWLDLIDKLLVKDPTSQYRKNSQAEIESYILQLWGLADPPVEAGPAYAEYLERLRQDPKVLDEGRRPCKLPDTSVSGPDDDRTLAERVLGRGYSGEAEAEHPGKPEWHPIAPSDITDVFKIRAKLADLQRVVASKTPDKSYVLAVHEIRRLESHLRQLVHGYIPEEAGQEYRDRIEAIRKDSGLV